MAVNGLKIALAGLSTVCILGCGADSNDSAGGTSNSVSGAVREWSVTVDAGSALAGDVSFAITNSGTIGHEFLVVKTDYPVGRIPTVGDRFAEDGAGVQVIDEISKFDQGTTQTLKVALTPGKYQLVCNLPGHYAAGMHAGFEVL